MGDIYVVGNFKGGTGKSTLVQMLGFVSAKRGRKTLIVDFDMQGNTPTVMSLTHENFYGEPLPYVYDKDAPTLTNVLMPISEALEKAEEKGESVEDFLLNSNLEKNETILAEKAVYNIMDNLDIIPADLLFELYEEFSNRQFDTLKARLEYAKEKLYPLFEKYDSVYLDVPPSINIFSKTAMYLADYVIIALQTQPKSLLGAQTYLDYLGGSFYNITKKDLSVVGVVPFMLESKDSVDKKMYETAKEQYGEHLLNNVVLKNARLKRYDATGITIGETDTDRLSAMWDKKTWKLFNDILDELDEHKSWYN